MITGESIERAEKFVCVLFENGPWPDSALDHMDINADGFRKFIESQVGVLREMYHDIDPRHEAAIATMFTHVFLCGAAASRGQGYSADEGITV